MILTSNSPCTELPLPSSSCNITLVVLPPAAVEFALTFTAPDAWSYPNGSSNLGVEVSLIDTSVYNLGSWLAPLGENPLTIGTCSSLPAAIIVIGTFLNTIPVGCAYTFNDKYLSELVVCTGLIGGVSPFSPLGLSAIAFTFAIPGLSSLRSP